MHLTQRGFGTIKQAAVAIAVAPGFHVKRVGETAHEVFAGGYAEPVQRCETNYRSHQEERIEGYRVVYKYQGQKYATRMPYDPGREIRVRVDVRPAG